MFKKLLPYILIVLGTTLLLLVLEKPFNKLDNSFSDLQFELRGQIKIDTNIITLYIDKDIMDSLGRVPLKWNYYARAIDGLSKFGAKAIGIDNVFDKNSPDYPTQASWLVTAIRNSDRVCVGGFFDKIQTANFSDTAQITEDEKLASEAGDSSKILSGDELDVPFPWLLKNAAGFGHLNFEDNLTIRKVPLVLTNVDSSYSFMKNGQIIPALAVELLRIYFHLPQDSIIIKKNELDIRNGDKTIKVPTENSQMLINYCGGINSLNMISITDFLQMFHDYLHSNKPFPELNRFKDKIVLIGLLGRRANRFAATPYDNKFPSIGIQANILDTMLRQRFLYKIPFWFNVLIAVSIGCFIFWFITKRNFSLQKSALISAAFILLYLLATYFLFKVDVIMSIQPAIIGTMVILIAAVYEFNLMVSDSERIEKEKHSVEQILSRSKQKILRLEESISKIQDSSVKVDSEQELNEYQNELTDLSTRFGDLSEYDQNNHTEISSLDQRIVYSKNSKMKKVAEFAQKIAPTNATVLIIGESGTGKELFAKAIHEHSERKDKKFITINCGAIPDNLLESELFGHEEGAYTGAHKQHKGYFENADSGTIFLDEITETNELFQVKLLRVLQSGEFNRVGGTATIKVDVRVIAATNKNIEFLIEKKKFREDLYYRLNVIKILVPPLRSRKNDIPVLARHFLAKENANDINISESVMQAFFYYDWPGNVRQFENVIKRASILANINSNKMIQLSHLPPEIMSTLKSKIDLEGQVIEKLREKEFSYNSISETAKEMGGLNRGTVSEYLRGIFFREFCENQFDIKKTARTISGIDDEEINKRVQSKIEEYLNNLIKKIDKTVELEQLKENLKNSFKKLPNSYYSYLEEIIEHYYKNDVDLPNTVDN